MSSPQSCLEFRPSGMSGDLPSPPPYTRAPSPLTHDEKTTGGPPPESEARTPMRKNLPSEVPRPTFNEKVFPPHWQVEFEKRPVRVLCPNCQKSVITLVEHELCVLNSLTRLLCCLARFCLCSCRDLCDVTHSCPYCQRVIHTYTPSGCPSSTDRRRRYYYR